MLASSALAGVPRGHVPHDRAVVYCTGCRGRPSIRPLLMAPRRGSPEYHRLGLILANLRDADAEVSALGVAPAMLVIERAPVSQVEASRAALGQADTQARFKRRQSAASTAAQKSSMSPIPSGKRPTASGYRKHSILDGCFPALVQHPFLRKQAAINRSRSCAQYGSGPSATPPFWNSRR
jgi:hypothetical protein